MSISLEQLLHAHEHDTIIAQPGEAIVNISAFDARRKVNGYVGKEISLLMRALDPALVYSEGRLVWRVAIEFVTPPRGHVGYIGALDVDAHTSELIIPAYFAKEIEANARALLESSSEESYAYHT
jgi:hypothetical protein